MALLTLGFAPAIAGVRAIALQGDAVPGVPAATFASFPQNTAINFGSAPLCDSIGHCTFYATTSAGVAGLWSDVTGMLAPVVIVGDVLPGSTGPDTLQSIGSYLMSDHGHVVFYGVAKHGVTTYGLWYYDASGFTLAAEDGEACPWLGAPTAWDLTTTSFKPGNNAGPIALNASGRLALLTPTKPTPASHTGVWTFDPPPVVNSLLCAQQGFMPGFASFTFLGPLSFNARSMFAEENTWYPGSGTPINGVFEGACALLGSVLSDGDLAPPVGGIPPTANILEISDNLPPDINASNAVAFASWLQNGGVTSTNNTVVWLHDTGGFHAVLRQGGTAPELAGGETLTPNTFGSYVIVDQPQLVSDAGSVVINSTVQPSNAGAVLIYRPDGTLHVLARDGDSAPGLAHRLFIVGFNQRTATAFSLNHSGQVLVQTSTRDSLDPFNASKLRLVDFTTDATGTLVPIVVDQSTYTVRTGLTGTLAMNSLVTDPLPSNGTDGRAHDFSNKGEFFFIANFTPNGGSQLAGVFAGGGPDLSYVGVGSEVPSATRLAPVVPNPSLGNARIAFELTRGGVVHLEVLDLAGRRVRTLRSGSLAPGHYEERWMGDDDRGQAVAHGMYFVRLRAPGADVTRRMVLLR